MKNEQCKQQHPIHPKMFCEKQKNHEGLHEVECMVIPEGNLKWGIPTRKEMGYAEGE